VSQIEIGLLSFAPRGYSLTKDGEKFGSNERVFAVVNMRGEVVKKWAYAASTEDGRETFLHWFRTTYPRVNPPFRGNVFIFRKRKAPSN